MTKFKNEIQIWSQGLMVEDVTKKETLINFQKVCIGKISRDRYGWQRIDKNVVS